MDGPAYDLGFATQATETDLQDLPVHGSVPPWLSGMLLRTAPAKYEVADDAYKHWFDGLAMLHRFGFANGRVSYSSRFLQSCAYTEALRKRRISRPEFATMPRFTWIERLAHWIHPRLTDNCNVSVGKLGDRIVAFTETPSPIQLDPQTLEVAGHYSYGGHVRGALSIAHPHLDYERHCHYTYVLEFGRNSRYHITRIDTHSGRPSLVTTISAKTPAYIHTIGMSERHLVVAEFPLVVNPLRLRFSSEPFICNYRWRPQLGTRFHVIDKETGEVTRVAQARAFFAFHHVNAFDAGNEVVADVVAFPDADIIDQLYLHRLRSQVALSVGRLTRFRIGPRGDVREEELSDRAIELPRIHYRSRAGRPYRYVYAAGNGAPGQFFDSLAKLDLEHAAERSWRDEECYPGEPVFVSRPGATDEDDGVVLSVVLDAKRGKSFLLVADAATFDEVARVQLPYVVTFGFHGNFFPTPAGED
jgi:beta,beta-carotene 9',10'-dioxygenase